MKSKLLLVIAFLIFTLFANAQITKGNFMIGGNGSFSSNQEYSKNTNSDLKSIDYNINANVGYFFFNNLATGININYQGKRVKYIDGFDYNDYSFGPYLRYYFLKSDKNYNVFFEGSYLFQTYDDMSFKNSSKTYFLSSGATIFFNSSVGVEFFIKYSDTKFEELDNGVRKIQIGIGLQIYLEKEN